MRVLEVSGFVPYETYGRGDGESGWSVLAAGAFRSPASVVLRIGHRSGADLAAQEAGTLSLWESPGGLAFAARASGPHVAALLEHHVAGTVHGVSPSYWPLDDYYPHAPDKDVRVITRARLVELSIVVGAKRPVLSGTRVAFGGYYAV